jgi:D-alanyl-D-alanine endopeptidase (penicillin-binding protein 7)
MRRVLLLLTLITLCGAGYVPVPDEFSSAIVMRPDGKMLYGFKPDQKHVAASLSKLVLAITMLDKSWNWGAVISMRAGDEVGGGRLRVAVGSKIKLIDLWQSALGSSANNAGMAMARIAGPGVPAFMKKMNVKARAIGAASSVFYDPVGMNPKNMTTAHDIALIARAAFDQKRVTDASQQGPYTFTLAGTNLTHTIKNTNAPLLDDPDVYLQGGKTGYLPESMYNYAAEMQPLDADGITDKKKSVIVVVLGAPSTQGGMDSAKRLAEWAWSDDALFKGSNYPIPTRALFAGMSGNDVKWVQERLNMPTLNGNFGSMTVSAVKAFQVAQGIAKPGNSGYGVVGPATRAKLVELAP